MDAEDETRWIQNTGATPWFDSATSQRLSVPLEGTSLPQAWTEAVAKCPSGVMPPSDYYPDADGNEEHDDWTVEGYVADQTRFSDVNGDGIADLAIALYACWSDVNGRWKANDGRDPVQPRRIIRRIIEILDSRYSGIHLGTARGTFIDSGLSAGPPLLLDPVDWGVTGDTRITGGTFSMVDLDGDHKSEMLQSTLGSINLGNL